MHCLMVEIDFFGFCEVGFCLVLSAAADRNERTTVGPCRMGYR
jgi:hypothetical protein